METAALSFAADRCLEPPSQTLREIRAIVYQEALDRVPGLMIVIDRGLQVVFLNACGGLYLAIRPEAARGLPPK